MRYDDLSEPIGNIDLLNLKKTAFVSEVLVPEWAIGPSIKWAAEHDFGNHCALCGFTSQIEKQVLMTLIRRGVPTIVALATPYCNSWPIDFVRAVAKKKTLVFSLAEFELPWMTTSALILRCNAYNIANADKVFVGFCEQKGTLRSWLNNHSNVSFIL